MHNYPTKNSSTCIKASCENDTSDPVDASTIDCTFMSAALPTALKETFTGKNKDGSSPAMLNSRLPEVVSSSEDTSGVVHSNV